MQWERAGDGVGPEAIGRRLLPRPYQALLALALPVRCAACGGLETLATVGEVGGGVCLGCRQLLHRSGWAEGWRWRRPDPEPPGCPRVAAALPYDGVVRTLLSAYKDGGRRDLGPTLADLLVPPLWAAFAAAAASTSTDSTSTAAPAGSADGHPEQAVVVPVPTSAAARRRRGDRPLTALARQAASADPVLGTRLVVVDALRIRRRVHDQAGLGAAARGVNLEHAMQTRPGREAAVVGAHCILLDDVLTTGATLSEAARALGRAGAGSVVAATLAATRRRTEPNRSAR